MEQNSLLDKILYGFDDLPYDNYSIKQEKLDITIKFRTSLFPWRGQFSPELVELLLDKYSHYGTVVFDPFAGSGTTLFECARRRLTCYATEINPSAIEMARTIYFVNLSSSERNQYIQEAEQFIKTHVGELVIDLFNYQNHNITSIPQGKFSLEAITTVLTQQKAKLNLYVCNLLINTIIRSVSSKESPTPDDFLRAFREHCQIVESLPHNKEVYEVFHTDARKVPLPDNTIDLIITSPPYINVFNYHQNNRLAMELMGWDVLQIAKSEFGSNRKHRQNRFLTVIQYILDMTDSLLEMRRLLSSQGRAIIIVGRESNVKGVKFKNGRIVAALALSGMGFSLENRQERKFKNKFGEIIYEDILHLVPVPQKILSIEPIIRTIAKQVLAEALEGRAEPIRHDILDALERLATIEKSPIFTN
ncbi:MAG: DNA methyltransferase [Chloroflexota bacterium]